MFTLGFPLIKQIESLITTNVCELSFALPEIWVRFGLRLIVGAGPCDFGLRGVRGALRSGARRPWLRRMTARRCRTAMLLAPASRRAMVTPEMLSYFSGQLAGNASRACHQSGPGYLRRAERSLLNKRPECRRSRSNASWSDLAMVRGSPAGGAVVPLSPAVSPLPETRITS